MPEITDTVTVYGLLGFISHHVGLRPTSHGWWSIVTVPSTSSALSGFRVGDGSPTAISSRPPWNYTFP